MTETYNANIGANDETQAVEQLKKELKNNGHRLQRVLDIKANDLPEETQEQIKYYLKYFNIVKVYFENKKYHVTPHEIVRNIDATDFRFIAMFKK